MLTLYCLKKMIVFGNLKALTLSCKEHNRIKLIILPKNLLAHKLVCISKGLKITCC